MSDRTRIIGIMQNMWSSNPDYVRSVVKSWRDRYDDDTYRRLRAKMTAGALFGGCVTGRRLRQYLGEELCNRITWEEASETITDSAKGCPPPDPLHLKTVIDWAQPKLVISFGKIAKAGIDAVEGDFLRFDAIHPAARDLPRVKEELTAARVAVEACLREGLEPLSH